MILYGITFGRNIPEPSRQVATKPIRTDRRGTFVRVEKKPPETIDFVMVLVCCEFDISKATFTGPESKARIINARTIFYNIMQQVDPKIQQKQLAEAIGYSMSSIRALKHRFDALDADLTKKYNRCAALVEDGLSGIGVEVKLRRI